jgi:hypothetical protein
VNTGVAPAPSDELADWHKRDITAFRRIYEAVTAGRGDVAGRAEWEP